MNILNITNKVLGGVAGIVTGALTALLRFPYTYFVLPSHLKNSGYSWPTSILQTIALGTFVALPITFISIFTLPKEGFLAGIEGGLLAALKFPYKAIGLEVTHYINRLSGNDFKAVNDALLAHLQALSEPPPVAFLEEYEIEDFKQIIASMKIDKEKQQAQKDLADYLHYLENPCCITLDPRKELSHPITIEAHFGKTTKEKERHWVKTYEFESLKKHISSYNDREMIAVVPETNDKLNDPHIIIYKGFAIPMLHFVKQVRDTVNKHPSENAHRIEMARLSPSQPGECKEERAPLCSSRFFSPSQNIVVEINEEDPGYETAIAIPSPP